MFLALHDRVLRHFLQDRVLPPHDYRLVNTARLLVKFLGRQGGRQEGRQEGRLASRVFQSLLAIAILWGGNEIATLELLQRVKKDDKGERVNFSWFGRCCASGEG